MEIFQLMVFVIPVFSPGLKLFAFFFFHVSFQFFPSLPPSPELGRTMFMNNN